MIKKIFKNLKIIITIFILVGCKNPNSSIDLSDVNYSDDFENQYEIVATPIFSLIENKVEKDSTLEITCATVDAVIYYTDDGTKPTNSSLVYTDSIIIDSDKTIKAIATKSGMHNSAITEKNYTVINDGKIIVSCTTENEIEVSNDVKGNTVTLTVPYEYSNCKWYEGNSLLAVSDKNLYKFNPEEGTTELYIKAEKDGNQYSTILMITKIM